MAILWQDPRTGQLMTSIQWTNAYGDPPEESGAIRVDTSQTGQARTMPEPMPQQGPVPYMPSYTTTGTGLNQQQVSNWTAPYQAQVDPGMAAQWYNYVDPETQKMMQNYVQYNPNDPNSLAQALYNTLGGSITDRPTNLEQYWLGSNPAQSAYMINPDGTATYIADRKDAFDPEAGGMTQTGPLVTSQLLGGYGPSDGSWNPVWPERGGIGGWLAENGWMLPLAAGAAAFGGAALGAWGVGGEAAGAGTALSAAEMAELGAMTGGLEAFYGTGALTSIPAMEAAGLTAAEMAALGVTPATMAVGTPLGTAGAVAAGTAGSNLLGGGGQQASTLPWYANPGVLSLIGGIGGGLGSYFGAGELSEAYDRAMSSLGQYSEQATGALTDYSGQAINAINTGLTGARGDILTGMDIGGGYLTSSLNDALAQLQAGQGQAVGAIQDYTGQGLDWLQNAYGSGRADLLGMVDQGAGALQNYAGMGADAINAALAQGRGDIAGYTAQGAGAIGDYTNMGIGAITGAQQVARGDLQTALAQAQSQLQQGYGAGIGSLQDYMQQAQGTLQDWSQAANQYLEPYSTIGEQGLNFLASDAFGGTASPLYSWQAEQGAQNINEQLAARGLWNSGAGMAQLSDFYAQLGAQEAARKQQIATELAKMGYGAGALQYTAGQENAQIMAELQARTGLSLAELQSALGQSQANLTSGMGTALANMGMQGGIAQGNLYGQAGSNLANLYQGAGANMANLGMAGGTSLANLYSQTGANLADLYGGAGSSLANMATGLGSSGANLLGQAGSSLGNIYMQGGLAGSDLYSGYGTNMANLYGQGYTNLANMGMGATQQIGNILYGTGTGLADIYTGTGTNMANLMVGQGGANMAQLTGPVNAGLSALNSYATWSGLQNNPAAYTTYQSLLKKA